MTEQTPVTYLMEDDRIVQLFESEQRIYALTEAGFILQANDQWQWFQVPAPIAYNLAVRLQEASNAPKEA